MLDPRPEVRALILETDRPAQPPVVSRIDVTASTMGTLDVGEIPLGKGVTFQLSAISGANQLVGFGRTWPMTVPASGTTTVHIPLRKPMAYIPGAFDQPGGALNLFDSAGVITTSAMTIAGIAEPRGVTTSYAGTEALVTSGTSGNFAATLVDTLTNSDLKKAALAAVPGAVTMSNDGSFAIVMHPEANKVSLLDLGQLRAGGGAVRVVDNVRTPGAAAIGDDGIYVLAGRPTDTPTCPSSLKSALVKIDPAAGTAGPERDAGFMARDVAMEVGGLRRIFVSDPCGGRVMAFSQLETGGPGTKLFDAPGVRSLALVGRKLLGAGAVGGTSPNGNIYSYDLDSGQLATLSFQMPDERYKLPLTTAVIPGQSVELRVEPDRVEIYELAVSPDATRAVALAHTFFHQDAFTLLISTVAASDIDAYYVLLIDMQSGAVLSRLRAECTVHVAGDPGAFFCNAAADSLVPATEYIPSAAAILWGWQ